LCAFPEADGQGDKGQDGGGGSHQDGPQPLLTGHDDGTAALHAAPYQLVDPVNKDDGAVDGNPRQHDDPDHRHDVQGTPQQEKGEDTAHYCKGNGQ